YRYFPEPDLMPVVFTDDDIAAIKNGIPELKDARCARYAALGLPAYDAEVLTSDPEVSDLFDNVVGLGADAKKASNFIMSEVLRLAKNGDETEIKITSAALAEILGMVAADEINNLAAKSLLADVWGSDASPRKTAEDQGLLQSNDAG
ncbi:MAG: Asp-tRNA(Asn)/Glu-tRNA(Gln) amidotransferase GatCAB subunit B, partial [Clostridia bacterium]|nr:Asp-tRNA(Asn)/Glu-tRNA(Gln) amidotransferase GatCAB subunit B [Clostridia bacterium]